MTLLLLLRPHTIIRPDDRISPGDLIYPDEAPPSSAGHWERLSVDQRIALVATLTGLYVAARDSFSDLSPEAVRMDILFAVAVMAVVGFAIIKR